jgi:uncharacterized protein YciW
MNSWETTLVAQSHHDDLLREAEQARLAHDANKKTATPNPALATLGRLLVEAGSRLQENYGDEHEDLAVERQHA